MKGTGDEVYAQALVFDMRRTENYHHTGNNLMCMKAVSHRAKKQITSYCMNRSFPSNTDHPGKHFKRHILGIFHTFILLSLHKV